MRDGFSELDAAIAELSGQTEDGSLDAVRMKSIFYSLFFGAENLRMDRSDFRAFVNCFVRYEERTRTVTDGDSNETEESYTAAVPVSSLQEIYASLERTLGRSITHEERANASEIYYRILIWRRHPHLWGGIQHLVKRTPAVRRTLCRSRRLLFSPWGKAGAAW